MDVADRYRRAEALRPRDSNAMLARMLISAQAPPPVGAQDFNAPVPPPVGPQDFAGGAPAAATPSPASMPPPAAPPPAMAPAMAPEMPPDAAAPVVPPMPDSVPVGMTPAKPDVMAAIAQFLKSGQVPTGPAPWTVNQGSYRDQKG